MSDNRKVIEKSIGGIDFVLFMFPSTGPHLVAYGRGRKNLGNAPLVGMGCGWIGMEGGIGRRGIVAGDGVWVLRWTKGEKRICLAGLSVAELQVLSDTFGLSVGRPRSADLSGSAVWPAIKEWVSEHPRLAKQFAEGAEKSGVGSPWYARAIEENAAAEEQSASPRP